MAPNTHVWLVLLLWRYLMAERERKEMKRGKEERRKVRESRMASERVCAFSESKVK
jgi:hypothetical protein